MVPCVLKFQSKSKQDTEKAEKLIRNSLRKSINNILPSSVIADQHVYPIDMKLLSVLVMEFMMIMNKVMPVIYQHRKQLNGQNFAAMNLKKKSSWKMSCQISI